MTNIFRASSVLLISIAFVVAPTKSYSAAANTFWSPEIKLLGSAKLQGSFVTPQSVYADSERIFLCSYQGDLFVLERDREAGFPLIQTIHLGSRLSAVRGDEDNVYITSQDGNLYVFSKTWPLLQLSRSVPLSTYGLAALEVVGKNVYVAKGQATMTASKSRLYISPLNPGDVGLDVGSMRSYGDQFQLGTTLVFDQQTLQMTGGIPNNGRGQATINTWQDFVYLTNPGCCGLGIDVYDGVTLRPVQFINRTTNTVAGTKKKGISLLVGGSETGAVDLYLLDEYGYEFTSSADLRSLTGFTGLEDVEIRALWVDARDNLVFAASSWGNDASRGPDLPSFFILEIR